MAIARELPQLDERGLQTPEPFPFSAGHGGALSPAKSYQRFAKMPDPTEANLAKASRTTLLDYFKTGQFGEFQGVGNIPIRYVVFAPPPHVKIKGVINLSSGTGESMIKYSELFFNLRDLRDAGYVIATMDHRGQGFSGKELPGKLHVEDSRDFITDQARFHTILQSHYGNKVPYTILGHSLGGAIAASYVENRPQDYDRLVMTSPMLGIESGMPDTAARLATGGMSIAGQGEEYGPGQKPYQPHLPFEGNKNTTSRARFEAKEDAYLRYPDVQVSGVTWGWLRQAMDLDIRIFAPKNIERLRQVEVHLLQAMDERTVANKAQDELVAKIGIKPHRFPGEHELLSAPDATRKEVLALIRRILTGQLPTGAVAAEIPAEDVMLEQLAHHFAYRNELGPEQHALLERWGYRAEPIVEKGRAGLTLMAFVPAQAGGDRKPVLAFRGTDVSQLIAAAKDGMLEFRERVETRGVVTTAKELLQDGTAAGLEAGRDLPGTARRIGGRASSNLKNLLADSELEIGGEVFRRNSDLIKRMLTELKPAIVTGHSLGGAVAQLSAVYFPGLISRVVTFGAPGISQKMADEFDATPNAPHVTHHRASNDRISSAGEAHLSGEVYNHDRAELNPLAAHQTMLLTSPQFGKQRQQLGLDERTLSAIDCEGINARVAFIRAQARAADHPIEHTRIDPSDPSVEKMRQSVAGRSTVRTGLLETVRFLDATTETK